MDFLSTCTSGGCGAKIGAGELGSLLDKLPVLRDKRLLVGFEGRDDAAVWLQDDGSVLVSTVDFFSPMVNDPYLFGKIAAANALSDVYAMGAVPLFALNLVCFPQKSDKTILAAMLEGGAEKAREAETVLAGGHSIYDHEPKYGLAVTGRAERGRVLRNDSCLPGDALVLTKALGVGIITCAARDGKAGAESFAAAAASMERLNKYAGAVCTRYPVRACTDVTGFGLLVHASEMAGAAHRAVIYPEAVAVLPGAADCVRSGYVTSGGGRNREFMSNRADTEGIDPVMLEILLDPQTSGGLLVAVPEDSAPAFLNDLHSEGDANARIIGVIEERKAGVDKPVTVKRFL